jgi:hypothetical protein
LSRCVLLSLKASFFLPTALQPLFQALADQAIIRQAIDSAFKISPTIHPLPLTKKEANFGEADDAFSLWFLVVL